MLDELRDEAARLCGWHVPDSADPYWERDGHVHHSSKHPFEYGDINPVAREWPDGFNWYKLPWGWFAERGGKLVAAVDGKDDVEEYEARLRLLVAAKKEGK